MLSESESPQRRYYSRSQAVAIGVIVVGFFAIMSGGLFASPYVEVKIFVAASLLFMGVVGVRFIRAGIEVFESGIRVRNVFSTFELPWQDIAKFEIGGAGLFPMVCLIRLKTGETKHASGIQERTNFPNGSANEMAKELNAELAKRTGGGSAKPQVALDPR
jgi:hypothetical protein